MTNRDIVDIYLKSGLIKQCVDCQFSNVKDKQFKDDFFNDLIIILYEYDNAKMNDAHSNHHFNALISRIIINNIYSKTSPYYKSYRKFMDRAGEEITEVMKDTLPDE